jgi:flagellar basal body-associated protein FliL
MKQIQHFLIVIILAFGLQASPALASGHGGGHDAAKETSSSSDSSHPNLVVFPQMVTTVLDGYRVRGSMVLGFGLEIEDEDLRKKASSLMPRLQDSFNSVFIRYAGNTYKAGMVPDANYIAKTMQAAADRMLGPGKSKFLISNLMVIQK